MIERVARAMRERASAERAGDSDLLGEFGDHGDDADFLTLARAAIEAMREPTKEMLIASRSRRKAFKEPVLDYLNEGAAWKAGINAALAQGGEG